jgi:hypothetical protein
MDSVYTELRYELLVWALKNFQCHRSVRLVGFVAAANGATPRLLIATNIRNENNSGRQQIEP